MRSVLLNDKNTRATIFLCGNYFKITLKAVVIDIATVSNYTKLNS